MAGFRSRAQVRKLWRSNPELAKRMTAETRDMSSLPERVKRKSNGKTPKTGYR